MKRVKLSELGEIVGGSTPSTKNSENYDGKISWITPKDLANYNKMFIEKGERSITEKGFNSCSAKMLPENSILFTSRAPIGYIAIAKKELCTNQGFKSIIPKEDTDYLFLYYLIKYNKEYIASFGSGTTFKEVSGKVMKDIEVYIPDTLEEQKKISKVLYKIDQKIEINNQINDNLQKIILSVFNRFLEENQSYNETTIKDAVKKIGTGADAIQRAPIVEYDTGIRCIRVGDMTNSRTKYQWGFTEMTDRDFENYKLNVGDIIVTRTAVNGLSYLIEEDMKVVCNNGLIKMSVNDKYKPLYIYLYLQTKDFYDYVHRIDGETSVRPNMKVEFFTSYKIMEIPIDKQNEICNQLSPLRKMQQSIIIENERLANLRDTLLPRLMNGEINLDKIEI